MPRPGRGCARGRNASATTCLLYTSDLDFSALTVDAVPEGRVVHPNTPITVVEGPLAAAQLLESPLLNRLNFPTLIATKASRVTEAALGRPCLLYTSRCV